MHAHALKQAGDPGPADDESRASCGTTTCACDCFTMDKMVDGDTARVGLMAKKKPAAATEDVLDSFETWLERQPVKPARARSGYIAEEAS